jgi:drug/metabolite transporter (DMT)-like permease
MTIKHTIIYNLLSSFFNVLLIIATKIMIEHHTITPQNASFLRNISSLIILLPLILSTLSKSPHQILHQIPHSTMFFRALFFSICAFIWPIVYCNIPLHIAMTLTFIIPFLSNTLLTTFLKEKIPSYIWSSMIISTIGVIIILQPHIHEFNTYYLLALLCIILWSIASTLNKSIAQQKIPTHIALYYLTIYSSIFTSIIIFLFHIPLPHQILLPLIILGTIGITAQYFVLKSYQTSTGYLVNCMEFLRFLMFLLSDILIFKTHITPSTIIGSTIIGLSIYYIIFQYKHHQTKPQNI